MIIYSAFLECNKCGIRGELTIFHTPLSQPMMRDITRKATKATGWFCVIESGERKDYCPACADVMKMKRKAK